MRVAIRQVAILSYKGINDLSRVERLEEAAPYVHEWIDRKRLSKLGFVSNLESLSSEKAEAFILIEEALEKAQDQGRGKRGNR